MYVEARQPQDACELPPRFQNGIKIKVCYLHLDSGVLLGGASTVHRLPSCSRRTVGMWEKREELMVP